LEAIAARGVRFLDAHVVRAAPRLPDRRDIAAFDRWEDVTDNFLTMIGKVDIDIGIIAAVWVIGMLWAILRTGRRGGSG